jgi:hypothetical protein
VLSQLQDLKSWRGSVFDTSVAHYLIPAIRRGNPPGLTAFLQRVRARFDRQAEFARRHAVREPGMTKTSAGDAFAAWREIEYGEVVTDEDLESAWNDIQTAAESLYSEAFARTRSLIRSAVHPVAERFLYFEHSGVNVIAGPDLVLFFADTPPLIIDWKVHTLARRDARPQLATYALALSRANPHADFPPEAFPVEPTDVRLIEAQLLTGDEREYRIDERDLLDLEDTIAKSAWAMEAMLPTDDLLPFDDIPPARYGTTCTYCPFRRMCWSDHG